MSLAVKQQLLQRAVDLIGSDRLAGRMGVSEKLLAEWLRGDATMPDGKLLVLAAIVTEAADKKPN